MGALRVFIHVVPRESSQEQVGGNALQCTADLSAEYITPAPEGNAVRFGLLQSEHC